MTELDQKRTDASFGATKTGLGHDCGIERRVDRICVFDPCSRIESKEMKLQLRSRDVNQVIKSVISKVEYLAKRKRIELV